MPLEHRIRLHDKVLQLRKRGINNGEIQRTIYGLEGVRVHKTVISDWISRKHHPLGNVNSLDAKPSAALTYIIGVKASDGYLYKSKKNRRCWFGLNAVDYEFAAETGRNLAKLLGRRRPYQPGWESYNHRWRVVCSSVLLYQFLQQPLEKLMPYVEHCRHCVAAFLRAFFDGEGSVEGRAVKGYNTNKEMLIYVQRLLRRYFEIETTGPRRTKKAGYRFRGTNRKVYECKKQCYYLRVRALSLSKYGKYIGFTIKRKQLRLAQNIQQ